MFPETMCLTVLLKKKLKQFLILSLGPAHSNSMPSSKASFRHPAEIDVIIFSPLKKEICFVADSGNHAIRYIDGVQNIEGPKLVGTLAIHPVVAYWKPEGLAVLSTKKNTVCNCRR